MPVPNRVAFSIFGYEIMWYGIMIALAVTAAIIVTYIRAPKYGWKPDRIVDLVLFCIPVAGLGARLYYVAFEWDYYSQNLDQILNFRGGGLAIHGGLIFGIGMGYILCRIWRENVTEGLDLVAPSIALGQSIGRWGNYFNSEAHGGPTDLPWAIEVNGEMVHPTFLYESIWCLLLFGFLLLIEKNRTFPGQIFLLYGILYSVERFFVEGLRTDSLMVFNGMFRQAQVFSVGTILVCVIIYLYLSKAHKRKSRMFY